MAFNLETFKGNFRSEGARGTLFEVSIPKLGSLVGAASNEFTFTCKAAQLPGKTVGVIEVPYFGRKVKVAGDQTFAEWTVTVINSEEFKPRNAFEQWMRGINTHVSNLRQDPGYKSTTATVRQFSKDGTPVKNYTFFGMFPSDISPIDVSWEANDTIEEFTVTLQYDYWESNGASSGSVITGN